MKRAKYYGLPLNISLLKVKGFPFVEDYALFSFAVIK